MDRRACLQEKLRAILQDSPVPEDWVHAQNTLEWLLRLQPDADEAPPVELDEGQGAPTEPGAGEEAAATDEASGARFVSHLADPRKIVVRCDAGSGSGVDEVFIAGEAPGRCVVQALGAGRTRASTVIQAAELKTYSCFAEGSSGCE